MDICHLIWAKNHIQLESRQFNLNVASSMACYSHNYIMTYLEHAVANKFCQNFSNFRIHYGFITQSVITLTKSILSLGRSVLYIFNAWNFVADIFAWAFSSVYKLLKWPWRAGGRILPGSTTFIIMYRRLFAKPGPYSKVG